MTTLRMVTIRAREKAWAEGRSHEHIDPVLVSVWKMKFRRAGISVTDEEFMAFLEGKYAMREDDQRIGAPNEITKRLFLLYRSQGWNGTALTHAEETRDVIYEKLEWPLYRHSWYGKVYISGHRSKPQP